MQYFFAILGYFLWTLFG